MLLQFAAMVFPSTVALSLVTIPLATLLSTVVGRGSSIEIFLHISPAILLPSAILLTRNEEPRRRGGYISLGCLIGCAWAGAILVSPIPAVVCGAGLFLTLTRFHADPPLSWKAVAIGTVVGTLSIIPLILIAQHADRAAGCVADMLGGFGLAFFIVYWILGVGMVIYRDGNL